MKRKVSIIKLPPDTIFHHDLSLMVFRPRGVLTEKRANIILDALEKSENAAARPFNRFCDFSHLFAVDLDFEATLRVSLRRQTHYVKRAPVKSAFYVPTAAVARLAIIHALVMESSFMTVKMFDTIGRSARWLRVPKEALLLDPNLL